MVPLLALLTRSVILASAVYALAAAAWAQAPVPPTVGNASIPTYDLWAVEIGKPISQIPVADITIAACGTVAGPPSIELSSPEDFLRCPAEPTGLREVYFEYDDEQAYIARAMRSEFEPLLAGTSMYGHPVIVSALVDEGGTVRGVRVATDDRVALNMRRMAYRLATNLENRFGAWSLQCQDLPPQPGQSPIGNTFVHRSCSASNDSLGQALRFDAHYFRRVGQTAIDMHSQNVVEGAFESTTRFELLQSPYEPWTE